MLTSVEIIDNTNSPIRYLPELKAFKNNTKYNFNKGINIIIGPNGSGKSTLLKLISLFTLCTNTMSTEVPKTSLDYPKIFNDSSLDKPISILDGVKIHHDYQSKVFMYQPSMEMSRNDQVLYNYDNFAKYLSGLSASTGEKTLEGLSYLFNTMFNNSNLYFPIQQLTEIQKNNTNDNLKEKLSLLLNYYEENKTVITKENFEFTVLLDEPDRNLDIYNVQSVYNILSYHKPLTQMICTLHNPILIYKLSLLSDINFIELEKGYLDNIIKFIKDEKK